MSPAFGWVIDAVYWVMPKPLDFQLALTDGRAAVADARPGPRHASTGPGRRSCRSWRRRWPASRWRPSPLTISSRRSITRRLPPLLGPSALACRIPVKQRGQEFVRRFARGPTCQTAHAEPARRAEADRLLREIADYTLDARIDSAEAWTTARYCLLDALGCGLLALNYPACTKLIGPVVPGAVLPGGARVPGTGLELDPVQAAFCIGAMVRWLDFNDTWLAAEWGHPSDNLGGILAVADYLPGAGPG